MQIKNMRPWEVEVPNVGVADANGVLDVPDELAGRPPKGDDPGEGLLAQPNNWTAAKGKPSTAEEE